MHALDLLTEDCWKEILKRVKDPKDLWSCSEACLTFQEILRKKRNQFMFDLILPLILEYLPVPYTYRNDELAQWKSLLKCRLVCKSWCESMDKRRDAEDEPVFQELYQFNSGEVTERFLQKFATHAGNPFLGRSVTLHHRSPLLLAGNQAEALNVNGNQEAFHIRKLRELLERFGTEIWNLKLEDEENGDNLDDHNLAICKNVQTVLGHLPNLRSLELWFKFQGPMVDDDDVDDDHDEDDDGHREGHMAELTSYIAGNPLPDLPQLEHIQAYSVNAEMMRFILVKYGPILKSLILDDPRGFPEQGLEMGNLSKLELTNLNAGTSLQCLRQLQAPQLETLYLNVSSSSHEKVKLWSTDELFRSIQHLPIRHLEVIADTYAMFLGESALISPEQRPYHGSLSSIFLSCPQYSASFNFLLYCPQLTRVILELDIPGIRSDHPKGVPELLDVRGKLEHAGSDFYQSNIWEHLPLLEHLTVGAVYGRGPDGPNWKSEDYKRDEYDRRERSRMESQDSAAVNCSQGTMKLQE